MSACAVSRGFVPINAGHSTIGGGGEDPGKRPSDPTKYIKGLHYTEAMRVLLSKIQLKKLENFEAFSRRRAAAQAIVSSSSSEGEHAASEDVKKSSEAGSDIQMPDDGLSENDSAGENMDTDTDTSDHL